jgi:cation transporter-like permease
MTESNRMQWNLGGWLGAQLGSTAWILVAGVLSLGADINTALIVIALFVIGNIAGMLVWRRRERLSAYAGIQILLPIVGIVGLAAVYVLENSGIYESIQIGSNVSARSTYGIIILVVAALMLMFYFRFGRKH